MDTLYDMHCHVDFLADAAGFAQAARERGLSFFSATVTPDGYRAACKDLGECPNVRVGAGLHPWWVHDGHCDLDDAEQLAQLVRETRFIGEIGLDFGKRCAPSREQQVAAFELVAQACAREGGKLLTVHAVHSADCALDILERTGCFANNQVIFHWYSDASDALWRAVRAGCYFSVNARMLATKRGREYARIIPQDRLLLETDLPPEEDTAFTLDAWEADLRDALSRLTAIRQTEVAPTIAATSCRLLEVG